MNTKHSKKGFTLLETLVAISILLIAVVGPMSIIGRSLPQSAYARDHAIAVNLAQEGIEAVRQKRDSNMLNDWGGTPTAWDSELIDGGQYLVDPTSPNILSYCGLGGCVPSVYIVRQNAVGWFYQSTTGGGTATKFQRLIFIQTTSAQEKVIFVGVYWQNLLGGFHSVSLIGYVSAINS